MTERIAVVSGEAPDVATATRAAERHGTFYVERHGAERQVAELFARTAEFFALPLAERMEVAARGPQANGYHGEDRATQVFAVTRMGPSLGGFAPEPPPRLRRGPELRTLFGDVVLPRRPAGFAEAIDRAIDALHPAAMRVLSAIVEGLGAPPESVTALFARPIHNLQLRYYDARPPVNPLPLGAHTDPPPITLIAQDDVGGLEALLDREWSDVRPLRDTLVCQFGAMMGRWTANRVRPHVHRVRLGENASRFSLVYNLLPDPAATIRPLPSCPSDAPPITVEEFLRTHLREAVGYAPRDLGVAIGAVVRAPGWSLVRATKTGDGLRLELAHRGRPVTLDVSRATPGRRAYKAIDGLAFSYRDRVDDLAALDALLPTLSGLADLLDEPAHR